MDELNELALNLHWSWNHAADELWEALDSYQWEMTQNPWVILQTVSRQKVEALLATPKFQGLLSSLLKHKHQFFSADAWFQKTHPGVQLSTIAYFSMEFMLTEALPIYSGGLGNVAGDQMKAASDLGVPVVGVGLLWGQGYFRQDFDAQGRQRALYPVNDPGQLPIQPLRRQDGEWLRLQIQLPGAKVWLRCWEVCVGRTKLFLLDSNDFANLAEYRGITSELYGGDPEMRLKQEIVLGIGGWRLLREIGLHPEVCHLNEGHAAFAVLERARYYMADHGVPFDVALATTRAGNLFTTHTAVPAGFDRFDPELVERYLGHYAKDELTIPSKSLLAFGRQNAEDETESFNMAYLALRGSGQVSGVSKPRDLPAAVSAMAAGGCAGRSRDEWHSCSDVGFSGGGRSLDQGVRCGSLAGRSTGYRRSPQVDRYSVVGDALRRAEENAIRSARSLRAPGCCTRRTQNRGSRHLQGRCTHSWIRATLCNVQAPRSLAARS
jgi:starch phosphorylase